MPRQIKFRVWDGESYLPSSDGLSFKPKFLLNGEWGVHGFLQRPEMGFIVQQFTGLLDKNNKEIFEGDVLQYQSSDPKFSKTLVRWTREEEDNHPGFVVYGSYCQFGEPEVIGNIFENPELLK